MISKYGKPERLQNLYDKNGCIIKTIHLDTNGNEKRVENYRHEIKGGNLVKTYHDTTDDCNYVTYKYNRAGLIEQVSITTRMRENGVLTCEVSGERNYNYGTAGQPVSTIDYFNGMLIDSTLYKYNKSGFAINKTVFRMGGDSLEIQMDSLGHETNRSRFSRNGRLEESKQYEYEYDQYGNWIKKRELYPSYYTQIRFSAEERIITYY